MTDLADVQSPIIRHRHARAAFRWRRRSFSAGTAILALVALGEGNAVARTSPETAFETAPDPWQACLTAIAVAERDAGLPRHLLRAVAMVESGRRDEADNRWKPWPWTINNAGDSYFLDAKAEAVAAVKGLRSEGETNIDVGCMQVNLRYHPTAFDTLEMAFDPGANTAYAAQLLRSLFNRYRSWVHAVALYHSPKYKHSFRYRQRVMRTWSVLRSTR